MIKVKARANYGFARTDTEFEEEFPDDTSDIEIEETMKDIVMEQVDWSWEKVEYKLERQLKRINEDNTCDKHREDWRQQMIEKCDRRE